MGSVREELAVPRVTINNYQDWKRLTTNIRQASQDSFVQESEGKRIRERQKTLETHYNKILERAFSKIRSNMRVNGQDLDDLDEESEKRLEEGIEPFDNELNLKVHDLSSEKLDWHRQVAEKRRTAPVHLREQLDKLLADELALSNDEATFDLEQQQLLQQELNDRMDDQPFWVQDAAETFQKMAAVTKQLAQDIPTQRQRSEHATTATIEITALKP